MRHVFVDYNHTGWGERFVTELFDWEREGLQIGEMVSIVGDAVDPRLARVVSLRDSGAEFEFVSSPEGSPVRR